MRSGLLGPSCRSAVFEYNHGFAPLVDYSLCSIHELPAVAQSFNVEPNDSGLWVFREVPDHVGLVHIRSIAVRYHLAHAKCVGALHEGNAHCSTLRQESDIALSWTYHSCMALERTIKAVLAIEHAYAIGTDDPDLKLLLQLSDLALNSCALPSKFFTPAG